MAIYHYVYFLIYFQSYFCFENAGAANFNTSTVNTSEFIGDRNSSFNLTDVDTTESATTASGVTEIVTKLSDYTETTEATTQSFTSTDTATVSYSTFTTPSSTLQQPLPLSGSLPPVVTDVLSLCPCNVKDRQCDLNCCCDPDCTEELALFTTCTVKKIIVNPRLCSQNAAVYSHSIGPNGLAQVQSSVTKQSNPDVFCIHSANYKEGLTYGSPRVPTEGNFDDLFSSFVGFFFGNSKDNSAELTTEPGNSPGYQYGDAIQTQDTTGSREFFGLPGPAGTAFCLDANPAAFLKDQTNRCVRNLVLARDCASLGMLNLQTYTNLQVLSGKDKDADLVGVDVADIYLQSLEGTQTWVPPSDTSLYDPVLLEPAGTSAVICNNVVLQVRYVVKYSEAGEIMNVTASFVLGAVDITMIPIQQEFQIAFEQETKSETLIRSSGNPGYVVGLPLVAGSKTADGIAQSTAPMGGFTVQRSTWDQDCLRGSSQRMSVLFGVDMVSGCTLRLEETANCSLVSELIFKVLKGESPPEYVASFGNSLPQNTLSWIPIQNKTMPSNPQGCSIPLSYHLEVRWTKYGTLVNPQAQIVTANEVIQMNTSNLDSILSGSRVLSISSSVTFTDVSATASPGFKVPPTIDAKLPFDFFFPFV